MARDHAGRKGHSAQCAAGLRGGHCIMAAKVWADFDRFAPASDRVARAAHRQAITEIQELVRRA
jgi:hypothetical protein